MASETLRHSIRRGKGLLEIVARSYSAALHHSGGASREAQRQAAAHYWQMLGHDLPLSERIEQHHKLTAEAPIIQPPRHRATA